jgi:hypothetical protein
MGHVDLPSGYSLGAARALGLGGAGGLRRFRYRFGLRAGAET